VLYPRENIVNETVTRRVIASVIGAISRATPKLQLEGPETANAELTGENSAC
jgi:hypothetical protein